MTIGYGKRESEERDVLVFVDATTQDLISEGSTLKPETDRLGDGAIWRCIPFGTTPYNGSDRFLKQEMLIRL